MTIGLSRFFKTLRTSMVLGIITAIVLSLSAPLSTNAYTLGDYEQGLRWYQKQDYEMAAIFFRKAIQTNPNNANIYYYLGDTYVRMNRLLDAERAYQQVLTVAPHSQAARLSTMALSNLRSYRQQKINWGTSGRTSASKEPGGFLSGYSPSDDDYLEDIVETGAYVRWDLSTMPLKIHVERSPRNVSNFKPAFIDKVYKGMDVWVQATNGQISYIKVDDPSLADIRVIWRDTIDTQGAERDGQLIYTAGTTSPNIISEKLNYMEVILTTRDIHGKPQTDSGIYPVAIHELGHALGLLGHSDDKGDIMNAVSHDIIKPSKRDLNTLYKLYQMEADISNLEPNQDDPDRAKRLAEQQDKSIEKLEAETQENQTSLNLLNLGSAYYRKAQKLHNQNPNNNNPSDKNGAVYWYRRALAAYELSIEKEPNSAVGYSKIAFVSYDMGNVDKSIAQISKAISLDPATADYYLQRAMIYEKAGKVVPAKNDLNTYLSKKPSASGTEQVESLKSKLN